MSSTSVTIGRIYARLARRRSIHWRLLESCPTDLSPTSVGVQFPTSTAGHGVLTSAMLKHRQSPDSQNFGVMRAFLNAVSAGDRSLIRSGPRESLESHLMAFAAERSRPTGAPVRVWD